MSIAITPVWQQVTPELQAELVAFWRANKAIGDEAMAATRAAQAVCVARGEDGTLAGVGTAVVKVLPRLRQPMYYYRQYFARSLRGRHQELPFYRRAKAILQDWNAAREVPESLGILLEVENAKIAAAYRQAHEPGFDATFIGYSPRGLQLRVSYFDGALLLPPAPVRVPALAAGRAGPSSTRMPPASRRSIGRP